MQEKFKNSHIFLTGGVHAPYAPCLAMALTLTNTTNDYSKHVVFAGS